MNRRYRNTMRLTAVSFGMNWIKRLVFAAAFLFASNGFSYEVWMGVLCAPSNAAVFTNTWSNTAAKVTGLNCNTPPCQPAPGTPCENETSCGTAEWQTIFAQFTTAAGNGQVEIPRSAVAKHYATLLNTNLAINAAVENCYNNAGRYGFAISRIMFYDNELSGTNYYWTVSEVQQIRTYLDATSREDVEILYDVRGNVARQKDWAVNSLVDHVLLEAEPTRWFNNDADRQTLLMWLWTNNATAGKDIIFQVNTGNYDIGVDPYASTNAYMQVRRLVRWLGSDLMGWDFNRSSRVIFMPVTYNNPTYTFYPETRSNPAYYTNTLTGVTLSLIEQKNLFMNRSGATNLVPAVADADDSARYRGTRGNLIGYWNCDPRGTDSSTVYGEYGGTNGTLSNGAHFAGNEEYQYKNGSLYFDGVDDKVSTETIQYAGIMSNFTLMAWIRPMADRTGTSGTSGQRYAIYPTHGSSFGLGSNHVGVGFSVGTNSIGVYEHGASWIPQKMAYTNAVSSWTHVAVTYSNNVPRLYINGVLISTGTASSGKTPHPGYWGGSGYGWYKGHLDEFRVYDKPLNAGEIVAVLKTES